jgi:hypothetical protein
MPYLSFRTTSNQPVELGGNKEEDFIKAFERHGKIARIDLAMVWVNAFFTRRAHEVARQKALQIGDEATAEKEGDLADDAEEEEDEAREQYYESIGKEPDAAPIAASSSATDTSNMYGDLKADGNAPVANDDDFM